jgi:hypothetical protein
MLKGITGGGGIGSNTSAYDYGSNEIEINKPKAGPVDMPWWLYLMLDKSSKFQREQMDAGAMADFKIDAAADAGLGLTGKREVMGGVSTVNAKGKLVDWTIRHETGHSVDQQIEFTRTRGRIPSFGGWREHNGKEAEVASAFLSKASFSDVEQKQRGKGPYSLLQIAGMVVSGAGKLVDFGPDIATKIFAVEEADLMPKLLKFDDALAVATSHPWTFSDGGASRVAHNGRAYQKDQYGNWCSYLTSARANALSNYQFSSPGEWFAEAYAAFYEPKKSSAARDRLADDVRQWFARTLGRHSTTKGQGRTAYGRISDKQDQGKLGKLQDFDDQLADALNNPKTVQVDRSKLPPDLQNFGM